MNLLCKFNKNEQNSGVRLTPEFWSVPYIRSVPYITFSVKFSFIIITTAEEVFARLNLRRAKTFKAEFIRPERHSVLRHILTMTTIR